MKRRGSWTKVGRLNGSDAGRMAKPVWLCSVCRCAHEDYDDKGKLIKPLWCKFCRRPEFDYFHSSGEAAAWAALHLRLRAGEIRNLKRQVPFNLLTVDPEGRTVIWGVAELDFTFEELFDDGSLDGKWRPIVADYKPVEGPSPDSVLKFRCLAGQGINVRIITDKGVYD